MCWKQGLFNEVLGLDRFWGEKKKQKSWDLESGNFKLRQVEDAELLELNIELSNK